MLNPNVLAQIQAMIRQKRAAGQIIQPNEVEAAYQAAIEAKGKQAIEQRRLDEQRRQFEKEYELRNKMYEDQKFANKIAGMGTLGIGLAKYGPSAYKGLEKMWGGEEAVKGFAPVDASPSTGVNAAPVGSAFNPNPGYREAIAPYMTGYNPASPDYSIYDATGYSGLYDSGQQNYAPSSYDQYGYNSNTSYPDTNPADSVYDSIFNFD